MSFNTFSRLPLSRLYLTRNLCEIKKLYPQVQHDCKAFYMFLCFLLYNHAFIYLYHTINGDTWSTEHTYETFIREKLLNIPLLLDPQILFKLNT